MFSNFLSNERVDRDDLENDDNKELSNEKEEYNSEDNRAFVDNNGEKYHKKRVKSIDAECMDEDNNSMSSAGDISYGKRNASSGNHGKKKSARGSERKKDSDEYKSTSGNNIVDKIKDVFSNSSETDKLQSQLSILNVAYQDLLSKNNKLQESENEKNDTLKQLRQKYAVDVSSLKRSVDRLSDEVKSLRENRIAKKSVAERMILFYENGPRVIFDAAVDGNHPDAIISGLKMLCDECKEILGDYNVTEFVPEIGSVFDYKVHEVISTIADIDAKDRTVVSVFRNGYMFGDELLKPAMIVMNDISKKETKKNDITANVDDL